MSTIPTEKGPVRHHVRDSLDTRAGVLPTHLMREMLDDIAIDLRRDECLEDAAAVFAWDFENAETDDIWEMQRRLKQFSAYSVGPMPEILNALYELSCVLDSMNQLFREVEDDQREARRAG